MRWLAVVGILVLVGAPARAEAPRLGVVLVVDQLSMAQLDKWEDVLRDDGLRRLLGGSVARDARYFGAPTLTAHGHATLSTGAYGARHGIVGNEWWERGAGLQVAGRDEQSRLLTGERGAGASPRQLQAPTLADSLRWSRPGAKVVALSLKARGAVFLGGARPDAALWFDDAADRWTTSDYYAAALPSWVPGEAVTGAATAWTRFAAPGLCALLGKNKRSREPAACAQELAERRAGRDDEPVEGGRHGFGATFPHGLPAPGAANRGEVFSGTPLADEALAGLAVRAIEGAGLGADEVPDLLTVSFSGFDYVGHDFGPESQESFDHLLRLDAALAGLLATLDARVGKGAWVAALVADHGVRPTPGKAAAEGQAAGIIDRAKLRADAEAALDAAMGARDWLGPMANTGVSFRDGVVSAAERGRADALVVESMEAAPGVSEVFPRSLFASQAALRGAAAVFARSWFDGRSPDFVVHSKPLWTWGDVASHGSAYLADVRVPFALYRGGRTAQRIGGTIDVASLAPTFALVLGAAPPAAAEAGILTEVVEGLK
jgi:hypothetical protein